MKHIWQRGRRLGLASVVLAIGVVGAAPVSASAPFVFIQDGSAAIQGTEPACVATLTGSTCTSVLLFVFKGTFIAQNTGNPDFPNGVHTGDRVCLEYDYETFDQNQNTTGFAFEFGCPHDTGHISFNGLNSATLIPTSITLTHSATNATRTVIVAGSWAGAGATTRSKSHSNDHGDGCIGLFGENLLHRDATFVGTIDGVPFVPDFVELTSGRIKVINHCP